MGLPSNTDTASHVVEIRLSLCPIRAIMPVWDPAFQP